MTIVRAKLRYLHSPDCDSLQNFQSDGPFGLFVQAIVGPLGDRGEESFGFTVCTLEWFSSEHLQRPDSIAVGRHFIFVREFNYSALEKFVREYCASCEGATWTEAAEKVARLGHWEFEDYRPFAG